MDKNSFAMKLGAVVETTVLNMTDKQYIDLVKNIKSMFLKESFIESSNADYLFVNARIRHCEDAEIDTGNDMVADIDDESMKSGQKSNMPCMVIENGNYFWRPIINIKTGQIVNWEQGKAASTSYKIVDECGVSYRLAGGEKSKEIVDYVPDCLCVDEFGYGDYMYLSIDFEGYIDGWNPADVYKYIRQTFCK